MDTVRHNGQSDLLADTSDTAATLGAAGLPRACALLGDRCHARLVAGVSHAGASTKWATFDC